MNLRGYSIVGIAAAITMMALLVLPVSVYSQNLRVHASPRVLIPLKDGDIYGVGGGGSLTINAELTRFLAPWAGLRVQSVPPASSDLESSLLLTTIGGGINLFTFPLPRLKIAGSAGGGVYVGQYGSGDDAVSTGNLYWEVGTEVGYRFSPGFTVSAGVDYVDFLREKDSLYQGLAVSLVVDLGFKSRKTEGRAILDSAESSPVFPILASHYQEGEFGSITIRNGESAEIRNVEVRFEAGEYTSSPQLCGEIDYLPRNGGATLPLKASFSDRMMTVTEKVLTTGEIIIDYELLGEARTSRAETTISIHDRNSFTWKDPKVLAAFVSPNDRALLDFSKYVAGLVRSDTRPEVDSNLQYALALFEGFRLSNIAWSEDPQTPYRAMRRSPDEIDYVQYPHQTISYRGGDADDLAVLYAAAVESVGVPSAIIPLEEDVIVAVKLEYGKSGIRFFFSDPGDFIFLDDEVWVPVRVSLLREGFLRAWSEGARIAGETEMSREQFFRLDEAWEKYPPAGVPGIQAVTEKLLEEQVVRAFNNIVSLVVEREVSPKAERMRDAFGPNGGTGRQRNALGVLYARYGVYREALKEFQAASRADYKMAHINIGNIAFLIGDYDTALSWYLKVSEEYPGNPAAIINLARTYYELDRFDEADYYFGIASEMQPELAERYSYLAARIEGSVARASAAMDRLGDMMWGE